MTTADPQYGSGVDLDEQRAPETVKLVTATLARSATYLGATGSAHKLADDGRHAMVDAATPLQRAAGRGVAATTIQVTVSRLLGLVGFTVLAHFLSAADYGTAALANVFVILLSTIAASGLGQALVQRQELDRAYLDTTFWLLAATGVFLTGCLAGMAYPLAMVFGQPLLGPVLLVLSINFTVIGLAGVPMALLQRTFCFGAIARLSVVSNVVATCAGIAFAVARFGVWALVVQTVLVPLITGVWVWRLSPYRPGFALRRSYVRPIYSVSIQFLGASVLDFLSQRTDDFLVGARLGVAELGIYSVAFRIVQVMMDVLANSLRTSTLSIFAKLQSKQQELRRYYLTAIGLSGLVVMPCFAFVLASADQLVVVVFGAKWHAAVPLVRIFALYGGLEAVMIVNQVFLQGAGAARTAFRLSLAGTILQVAGFLVAFRFGLVWVAAAYVLRSYFIAPIGLTTAARLIGTSARASVARVGRPAFCSLVMGALVYLVDRNLPGASGMQRLGAMLLTAVVTYAVLARLMMPKHLADLKRLLGTLRLSGRAGAGDNHQSSDGRWPSPTQDEQAGGNE